MFCNAQQEKAIFKEMLQMIDTINYWTGRELTWSTRLVSSLGGMLIGLAKALDAIGSNYKDYRMRHQFYGCRDDGVHTWAELIGDYVLIEPKYRLATLSKYLTDRINEIDNISGGKTDEN